MSFLVGFPVVGLGWLLLPALSNYWAMNAVLFALCFGLSFTMARVPLFTYGRLVAVLAISTLVALNPNEPVPFRALIDAYLGLIVGVGLGAVVGRALWPVLPQGLLRGHMVRYFGDLRRLLAEPGSGEYVFSRTALLPVEAMQAIRQMALPRCPADERENLTGFVRTAQPLGWQVGMLGAAMADVSNRKEFAGLQEPLRRLTADIDRFLAGMADGFRRHDARLDTPDLCLALSSLEEAWTRWCDDEISSEDAAAALGLLEQCRAVAMRLRVCGEQVSALRLHCYLGDVAL